MSKNIFVITFIGCIVSLIGTMIGALIGILIRKPTNKLLGSLIGFSGGLMLAVVVFNLIPEAVAWNFWGTMLFAIFGIILMLLADRGIQKFSNIQNKYIRVALITAIGLIVHNVPEGVIMGAGFISSKSIGIKMALIIAIHDIPEGLAIAAPLVASKTKPKKILLYSFFAALPTAFGVILGIFIGNISPFLVGVSVALAAGIMLYICCGEMLPESSKLWDGSLTTVGTLIGILLGLIIINII